MTVSYNLSTYFDQIIVASVSCQHRCHYVTGLSFSHGAGIQHHPWVCFGHSVVFEFHTRETDKGLSAVYLCVGHMRTVFETESP